MASSDAINKIDLYTLQISPVFDSICFIYILRCITHITSDVSRETIRTFNKKSPNISLKCNKCYWEIIIGTFKVEVYG